MKTKKSLLVLTGLLVTSLFAGCNKKPDPPNPDEEVINFEAFFEKQAAVVLAKDESQTYTINKPLNSHDYIQMLVKTTGNVKGQFVYSNVNGGAEVIEEFFIESTENGAKETDFRQFLDSFRPEGMAKGNFEKNLKRIQFTNINEQDVTFELLGVNVSDRCVPDEKKMLFLEKDSLKVGMDLITGGTLSYLERVDYDGDTVDLVLDKNSNLQIGVDFASRDSSTQVYSNHVNLINIYDAGRQIQQSYYASIGGYGSSEAERKDRNNDDGGTQNGYTRNISVTADKNGYYWPYNPVQGGDEKVNLSQIIDFRKTKDELYCKTRALDWAGNKSGGHGNPDNNRVTKSYMENWFKIKDGLLYATNRFIDWNGFTDLEGIEAHNIEMPATYISQPLNHFRTYNGPEAYKEDEFGNLDETPGLLENNDNLGPWKAGGHKTNSHSEDWFGWTNSEDFGVGVYIPGATYYSSGRSAVGTGIESKSPEGLMLNKGAYDSKMTNEFQFNKPGASCDFDPCYVRNVSYTAPVKAVKMKEYIPLEYTYVVAVDYLQVFREQFKDLYESKEVSDFNEKGLNAWN